MRTCTCLIPVALALAAIFPFSSVRSEYLPPDKLTGGWEAIPIPGAKQSRILATSDKFVALVTDSGEIVFLNAADHSVALTVKEKPTGFSKSGRWDPRAGFINGKLVVANTDRGVRIDELDPENGTWGRSAMDADFREDATRWFSGDCGSPVATTGEIRLKADDGGIRRWNLADWSPLSTLTINYSDLGYSKLSTVVFGGYAIRSYSSVSIKLEDGTGKEINLQAPGNRPLGYSTQIAASKSFLVYTFANASNHNSGVCMWRIGGVSSPPRQIPWAYENPMILGDRYLVGFKRDGYGGGIMGVMDLTKPTLPGIRLEVPYGFNEYHLYGTANNIVYVHSRLQKSFLVRMPVIPDAQLVRIDISDATANERDGRIEFEIRANPAPASPITVAYETRQGTALEGLDYIHKTGTVTLSPDKPSAKIPVTLRHDSILEGYETFTMAITSHSDGWLTGRKSTGVIIGTGMVEVASTDVVPNNKTHSGVLRRLPAGILLHDYVNRRYYFCRNEQAAWTYVSSMELIAKDYSIVFVPSEKPNEVIVAKIDRRSPLWHFHRFDVVGNKLVESGRMADPTPNDRRMAVSDDLYMATSWTNETEPVALLRRPGLEYVRGLVPPVDVGYGGPSLIGTSNGFTLMRASDLYLHKFAPDGSDLYHRWRDGIEPPLNISPDGIGTIPGYSSTEVFDFNTGTVLQKLNEPYHGFENDGSFLCGETFDRRYRRFTRTPGVPAPVGRHFAIPEHLANTPVSVRFTEAAEYPVTVRVVRSSSSADFVIDYRPVTIIPGQTELTMPITVADDRLPEANETQNVVIRVSANGRYADFDLWFGLENDNDVFEFDNASQKKLRIPSSAIDVGAGYPAFSVDNSGLADPTTKTAFAAPKTPTNELFGHTIAADSKHMIAGSPGVFGAPGNSVYVFDRKKRARVTRITHTGANTGFGAVLALKDDLLLVGAPGRKKAGFVHSYSIPGGKLGRQFKRPGKANANDRFGAAIAIDRKWAWVGAPGHGAGKAYQFSLETGRMVRELKPPLPGMSNFGQSIALCGPYLAIGAPSDDRFSSVIVFRADNGEYAGRISSPFDTGGFFGASLAVLSGRRLAVGCPTVIEGISPRGSVHVHDLGANDFHLTTMLKPVVHSDRYDINRKSILGAAGSLSGSGNFLAMQFSSASGSKPSPLCVYDGAPVSKFWEGLRYKPTYSQVVAVVAKRVTSKKASPIDSPRIAGMATVTPDDALSLKIEVSAEPGHTLISLPNPAIFVGGVQATLEYSEDLIKWHDVAKAGGSVPSDWIAMESGAVIQPDKRTISLPPSPSGRGFFRLRTEAPAEP